MEVFLYNSTVCRLCGEENDNGNLLYSHEENNQNLCEIINTYLPLKVLDDGELPRTICPGCTIQLEATVEFLNLIINGQKVIRELHQRENEYKKHQRETEYKKNLLNTSKADAPEIISEKIVYEINTSNGVYQVEHPISLQVAGLEKPKRKRGRPPKKTKTPEELAQKEVVPKETQEIPIREEEGSSGKRRRKAPTRFHEAVQGQELERIFLEEGVIDVEESDPEKKFDINAPKSKASTVPEVIGHLEESGEPVVMVKGKGRGRPKGRMRQRKQVCAICGMEFWSVGRYMSHVAQHGPAVYRCSCAAAFSTKLQLDNHQEQSGHTGRDVEPCDPLQDATNNQNNQSKIEMDIKKENQKNTVEEVESILPHDLPDLSDVSRMETEPVSHDVIDVAGDTSEAIIKDEKSNVTDTKTINETTNDDEVKVEKGKVKIKCNHCDKLFSNRQSKSLHIKAAHLGEKPFVCTECPMRFAYPQSLAVHKVAHRRTKPTRGYACDLCGKVLNHPSSVVYHKQAEHSAQKYVCGTCGKHFRHKQLLQRHQLVHSQARPFSCKICNSKFKTKANLLNHQLLHTGIKKFSCDICKQRFSHKTSLTLHMRWHAGTKPHACNVCGKTFSQKGNLSEHERIHTGEKPYQCSQCPRRFTTSSQRRLHAKRHMTPSTCGKCGRRISSYSAWAQHIRRGECGARSNKKVVEKSKQPQKQISLLVSENGVEVPQVVVHKLESALEVEDETEIENENERVIYVAYDDDDATAFHILDPEQSVKIDESDELESSCSLYAGASLLAPHVPAALPALVPALSSADQLSIVSMEQLQPDNMQVTDEAGNPLHFTMQDGTKLAITSVDGKTLQVITQDGQTIPVEIKGFNDEEEEEIVIDEQPIQHDLNKVLEDDEANTHYYTLV